MGGLRKKMPITAVRDAGRRDRHQRAGRSGVDRLRRVTFGESPFRAITRKTRSWRRPWHTSQLNPTHFLLFVVPLLTAGITAFYMFRLWFYDVSPAAARSARVYDHAHESPWVMTAPLIVLSFFAIFCAVGGEHGPLFRRFCRANRLSPVRS